ncbi:eCIS core domain-containing protein [Amycolatopsis dendrobii]|uniref:eCIS core domain-containing protein n=1 Tax=Amycolatopsis dendrobii TaxID=2760662 RepID=UPI001FE2B19D|nr:DUF4157 domain-containing protein [Amycolatopsis dendrobii]
MRAHGHRPRKHSPGPAPRVAPEEAQETPTAAAADFSNIPAHSSGVPLPAEVRRRLEERWGEDLGGVRVHTGPEAARTARDLGAVAYTSGEDIVVAGDPDEHLLRHEAAHVVQQRHASRLVPGVSSPRDPAERAAEAGAVAVPGGRVAAIQRQVDRTGEKAAATRDEVEKVLTAYLQQVQQDQGGQTLHNTDQVKFAVLSLFAGDPVRMASVQAWLSGPVPGTPASFAHAVVRQLPAAIPAGRLEQVRGTPVKPDADKRPKNAGEAAGAVIVDTTLAPILRRMKLSDGLKKLIVDGAKSAVASGLLDLVDTAMAQARITDAERGSIHSAVAGLIKQQPGKPMERQQEGAGSPYAQIVPPSIAPPVPSAPGEQIVKGPSIPFDFSPRKDPPKPALAPAPPSPAVVAAARQFDRLVLTPPEARGTEREGDYALPAEFATTVATLLDDAQKNKRSSVRMDLPASYRAVKDRTALFQEMKKIFFAMRDALPHHASQVVQIYLLVEGRQVYSFELH